MSQNELPVNEGDETFAESPALDPAAGAAPADAPGAPSEPAAELQSKLAESRDRYLRLAADFDNFRKRSSRDRAEAIEFANKDLMARLLPVLDNLESALAAADDPNATVASIRTGVGMIGSQLRQALTESGLEEVDAAGQDFDPNFHEAVSQLESAELPEGRVLHQLRKGYRLRGRLLRPATVVVAKSPAA